MAASLKARKGLVTRQSNALTDLVKKYSRLAEEVVFAGATDMTKLINEMNLAQVHIRALQASLEKATLAFAETVDSLEIPLGSEEEGRASEHIEKANTIFSESETLLAQIEVQKQIAATRMRENVEESEFHDFPTRSHETSTARVELPKLPIPEFNGNSWQWDNFWELFNATVHSLPLSNLQKFNYLLKALKGEARESAERFQVTSSNYPLVLKHLQEKYGNASAIITSLHEKLQMWTARSMDLKDQSKLFDKICSLTKQLESKGENLDSPWLLSKILAKFRKDIQRRVLERKVTLPSEESWNLKLLMDSLDMVIRQEQEIERYMPAKTEHKAEAKQKPGVTQDMKRTPFCFYCESKDHWSTSCTKLKHPNERIDFLKTTHRCLGCGSKSHTFADCKSKGCYYCGKKHHSSTCFKSPIKTNNTPSSGNADPKKGEKIKKTVQNFAKARITAVQENNLGPSPTILAVSESPMKKKHEQIFLLTGHLTVVHPTAQKSMEVEVLFDTGADRSFIDSQLAKDLQLKECGRKVMQLTTFGSHEHKEIECLLTSLRVWDANGEAHTLQLFTFDKLCPNLSQGGLDEKDLEFIRRKHIRLCVPHEKDAVQPKILIGCDQLWDFINFEAPHFNLPSGLTLIPTKFGYTVSGRKTTEGTTTSKPTMVNMLQLEDKRDQWEQHWNLQINDIGPEYTGPEKKEKARVNAQVLEDFNNSIERRLDEYYVKIPFKEVHDDLPDNRALAWRRLKSILQKYKDQESILQQYDDVFKEQVQTGILEEVNESEDTSTTKRHYLPHQPVITPSKQTTKFRVVFDASAHYKGCPSLNDVVHQGPTILPKLYGILLRFRTSKYVLLADVEKAFLQVRLLEEDRNFTRCLWVKNIAETVTPENLIVYRFTRVTFGINASPFLLSATILFHLNNVVQNKILAEEIAKNLYVDNLFIRAESKDEAVQKYREVKDIFSSIHMNLREFVSNNDDIMSSIAVNDQSSNRAPKVLGLQWDSNTDMFHLQITITVGSFVSKRTVAQTIASIYDPLGWYVPLLVRAKHFQQQLWKQRYDWDEPLSPEEREKWCKLIGTIDGFQHKLPRMIAESQESYTLVTYTDASSIAMAACSYLTKDRQSHLIMAKSKLSEGKREVTMPKLELNAIAMGTRLSSNILQSLEAAAHIERILILTDSEIALKWITSPPNRNGGVFITNRVKEVQNIARQMQSAGTPVEFGYIDTRKNLADCGTRGVASDEFRNHPWWTGYTLKELYGSNTPKNLRVVPDEDGEEPPQSNNIHVQISHSVLNEKASGIINLQHISSYARARRILAYTLRFLKTVTSRVQEQLQRKLCNRLPWLSHRVRGEHLTATDILDAHHVLIRNHQMVHVTDQYRKEVAKNLNLKEDEAGLLRAYGRLNKSNLSATTKNPIFVAPNTELCRLIIDEIHGTYHKGTAHTVSDIRQTYWIPRVREQVKKRIRQCIPCQKLNHLAYKYPEMTDLPAFRVNRAHPFQHIGLDYFGPITIFREDMAKTSVYGCIFTCAVTRMIHLEVVPDGTAEKFINAFRRFVARRGKPESVTCDNAPTFNLGSQILNHALESREGKQSVERVMSDKCIVWKHITPYSPWMGGFYERLIKAVKGSMMKSIGRRILTMDQFTTLLTEIEACLNTRPLTYQESDINDTVCSLRPIDFIQKEMDINFPLTNFDEERDDPSYVPSAESSRINTRLQATRALQSSRALTERYWRIWKDSYLTALREQHRRNINNKKGCACKPLEGEVVLIVDSNQKRNHWKLGRITKLVQSNDGAIREAEVFCGNNSVIKRPINLLIPLEISGTDDATQKCVEEQGREKLPEETLHAELEELQMDTGESQPQKDVHGTTSKRSRYNLRPRAPFHANSNAPVAKGGVLTVSGIPSGIQFASYLQLLVTIISAALVMGTPSISSTPTINNPAPHTIECRPEGIYLHSPTSHGYEICVNNYCMVERTAPIHKIIRIPAKDLLYEYEARWKIETATNYTIIETVCPEQPFCASVNCIICSDNIFNPECWPFSAIAGAGILLYIMIALCYTICYIPVTIGHPIRLLLRGLKKLCIVILNIAFTSIRGIFRWLTHRQTRTSRFLEALALCGIIASAWTCQTVNVFSHHMESCVNTSGRTVCNVEVVSVLKINPFKKDACVRFQHNHTTILEMRVKWIGLRLLCHKTTLMHTRNIVQKVVDSKRCPLKGSCVGNKCADINSSSLLPELAVGNAYPGTTKCLESCGGIGCECLLPSSGCLFYRICAVPVDGEIYELFSCAAWEEEVKAQVQVRRYTEKMFATYTVGLKRNVPVQLPFIDMTLSVLSWPYFSVLDAKFITNTHNTAIWSSESLPHLQCPTRDAAQQLQCNFFDSCECSAAEVQVNCYCESQEIRQHFRKIENLLPVTFPFLKFTKHPRHDVMAQIEDGVSSEIIVNIKAAVDDSVVDSIDEVCKIDDTTIQGCYKCNRGANAVVTCASSSTAVTAEIVCGTETFTVPCAPSKIRSTVRFLLPNARIQLNCTEKCGSTITYFEITGILKYVNSLHERLQQMDMQTHNVTSEFHWPDMKHIVDVYIQPV